MILFLVFTLFFSILSFMIATFLQKKELKNSTYEEKKIGNFLSKHGSLILYVQFFLLFLLLGYAIRELMIYIADQKDYIASENTDFLIHKPFSSNHSSISIPFILSVICGSCSGYWIHTCTNNSEKLSAVDKGHKRFGYFTAFMISISIMIVSPTNNILKIFERILEIEIAGNKLSLSNNRRNLSSSTTYEQISSEATNSFNANRNISLQLLYDLSLFLYFKEADIYYLQNRYNIKNKVDKFNKDPNDIINDNLRENINKVFDHKTNEFAIKLARPIMSCAILESHLFNTFENRINISIIKQFLLNAFYENKNDYKMEDILNIAYEIAIDSLENYNKNSIIPQHKSLSDQKCQSLIRIFIDNKDKLERGPEIFDQAKRKFQRIKVKYFKTSSYGKSYEAWMKNSFKDILEELNKEENHLPLGILTASLVLLTEGPESAISVLDHLSETIEDRYSKNRNKYSEIHDADKKKRDRNIYLLSKITIENSKFKMLSLIKNYNPFYFTEISLNLIQILEEIIDMKIENFIGEYTDQEKKECVASDMFEQRYHRIMLHSINNAAYTIALNPLMWEENSQKNPAKKYLSTADNLSVALINSNFQCLISNPKVRIRTEYYFLDTRLSLDLAMLSKADLRDEVARKIWRDRLSATLVESRKIISAMESIALKESQVSKPAASLDRSVFDFQQAISFRENLKKITQALDRL